MSLNTPFIRDLKRNVTSRIPTDVGEFRIYVYTSDGDKKEHIAMVIGDVGGKSGVLARVHSECFTGEVLGSRRCDCREQLAGAMQKIADEGCGVLIYLRQEGRGIGLLDKLRAYNLQDQGYDTVDANLLLGHQADEREYAVAAMILRDLRVLSVRLLTNNPLKIECLREQGIVVERRIPLHPTVNDDNARYLLTKAVRMNHLLKLQAIVQRKEDGVVSSGHRLGPLPETRDDGGHSQEKERVSLYFTGPRQVSVRSEELPVVGAGQVLVRTIISAISPGTESLIYRGEFPDRMQVDESIAGMQGEFSYPIKYGYSAAGQVAFTGKGVDPGWIGRYVMAFHPHESHFTADPGTLIPLPDDIGPEDGVFLPNMETAVNFLMDGSPLIGEKVVVFGQGIVGLLTTSLLARFPLAGLITLDRYPLRRNASKESGAGICLDPEDADLQERLREHLPDGADLAYEISGSPAALDQALLATGFAGRIVIGSWYGSKQPSLSLGGRFHRSRIRMASSQVSSMAPEFQGRWTKTRRFDVAWEMIRQLKPSRFITHRFPVRQAASAYQLLDKSPGEAIQVLLTYGEGK